MLLRSMKSIQYLQGVALTSILLAIFSVMITSIDFIQYPPFEKTLTRFDFKGVPYFFGICTFAFEGTNVTLEIYR